ncbi:hypothetical protein D9M70_360560 [compost metagenome]
MLRLRQARDLQTEIVLVGPEPGDCAKSFLSADHVAGRGLRLAARIAPALEANVPAARLRHRGAVTGRKDVRVTGAKIIVRQDAVSGGKVRRLGERHIRQNADRRDDDIGRHRAAIGEENGIVGDRGDPLTEMKRNAFILMPRMELGGKARWNRASERLSRHLDNADGYAFAAQNGRELHADQTTTDDGDTFSRVGAGEDCRRIRIGAKVERALSPRACQPPRASAGRKQQLVVCKRPPVAESDRPGIRIEAQGRYALEVVDTGGLKRLGATDRLHLHRAVERLRQRRALIWQMRFRAGERDAAGKARFTQRKGRAGAGFPGADDDDAIHGLLQRS